MTLTPEQKAEGWIEWNGGPCPIKDVRTIAAVKWRWNGQVAIDDDWLDAGWHGNEIIAYRIIEAHGADAEPARPTPFPADYSELVFDDDDWSQTVVVDGKRPEWLRDDDEYTVGISGMVYKWTRYGGSAFAIRVRRREPKRETAECFLIVTARSPSLEFQGSIDLIDGHPDLSTLKIAEDAL